MHVCLCVFVEGWEQGMGIFLGLILWHMRHNFFLASETVQPTLMALRN